MVLGSVTKEGIVNAPVGQASAFVTLTLAESISQYFKSPIVKHTMSSSIGLKSVQKVVAS